MRFSRFVQEKKKRQKIKPKRVLRKFRGAVILVLRFALLGGIAGAVCYLLFFTDYLKLKEVDVLGEDIFVNSSEVKNMVSAQVLGKNVLTLDVSKIVKVVSSNFLAVEKVDVRKVYPSKLVLYIKERTPLALLSSPKEKDTYYMADKEGFVLGLVDSRFSNLPKIQYEKDILVGQFINKEIAPVYLELINNLEVEKLKASSISVGEKFSSFYVDGIQVLLNNFKTGRNSFKIVSAFLKKGNIEGRPIKRIDLRYDKVIVLYD